MNNNGKPDSWGKGWDYRIGRFNGNPLLIVNSDAALQWAHDNMADYTDRVDVWGFCLGGPDVLPQLQLNMRWAELISFDEYVEYMEYEEQRKQAEAHSAEELV